MNVHCIKTIECGNRLNMKIYGLITLFMQGKIRRTSTGDIENACNNIFIEIIQNVPFMDILRSAL